MRLDNFFRVFEIKTIFVRTVVDLQNKEGCREASAVSRLITWGEFLRDLAV